MQQLTQPVLSPHSVPVKRRTSRGAIITFVIGLTLLGLVFIQRQYIMDWWALRGYTAPAEVVAIADQTTMTENARKVFYVNKPQLLDRSVFSTKCPDAGSEKTIVLGCYHGNQQGIFLYDVTDDRLTGVEQVTAAHEMLHAEYDRLSISERKRINTLLENYYNNELTDRRLLDTIDAYKISEPNDVVNEMHSIFATEIADLPPELETYYQKYFTNRKAVVAFANAYQNEFTSRKQQVAEYDTQLASLKQQINTKQQELETQNAALVAEREQLNAYSAESNFKAYNAGVSTFNQHVAAYNSEVEVLKGIVAEHNAVVDKRNAIALEQQELSQAINSHLESL